jgi:hypothetical protein
MVDC